MNQPTHLAIVTLFPPPMTGIGQYAYHISNALAHTGKFTQITLLTQISPNTQQVDYPHQIKIERLWYDNRLDTSWKILTRLRQLQPDLVWYNLGTSSFGRSPLANAFGMFSPALSRIAGLPSVITLHELLEQADLQTLLVPGGRLVSRAACLIRFLTTQTDVVCVTLRQHAEWLSAKNLNTHVMHIPHGLFDAPELLASSPNPELLFFGHAAPFRGLEMLLKVFRSIRKRYPSLRLTIAGAEHPRFPAYLEQVRRSFGEHPAVRWLGYVPEVDLRQIFARATIVVLPYTATTGSSSVLYRAAGWGRPVVASNLPELRAIADEERLWVEFFPSGDEAGLAATLERLLADPEQRATQAHHNYYAVMDHLTLEHTCRAYLRAFELALVNQKRDARGFSTI